MKNKYLIFIISYLIFCNISFAEPFIFKTSEIEIREEGNLILASSGTATSSDGNLEIQAEKFEYYRNTDVLKAFNGVAFIKDDNLKIEFNNLVLDQKKNFFEAKNKVKIFQIKKDFENLGYSSDEIIIHLLKLSSTPLLYSVLTILASIIMFNFRKDKSLFFHIILGILMSVIIYYINFMFSSLGNNGKIPIIASIFLPILFISIFAIIGLIRVNEK